MPPNLTTAVVPFNDGSALEAAFATGEIAAMLPDPGYHVAIRELCTRYGVILIIDETHTLCAGPGGTIARDGLDSDAVGVGESIGGGIPAAA